MAFKFTEEQLNTLDKSFIVNLFLQLQDQNDKLSGEIQELNKKMEVLIEQITLANKNRFGRSSEKMTDTSQICFMEVDGTIVFFNEAEAVSDLDAEEPDTLENKPARKAKAVGKKEADIKDLPVNIINHYLTDEEFQTLRKTEEYEDEYTDLWKTFFHAIAIDERKNYVCQRNLFPLWKRKHAVEFKK